MKKHFSDMYRTLDMIHVKDNIFLVEKNFLFNQNNYIKLKENGIKRILVCTEYIDKDIIKDVNLFKFIRDADIELLWVFDTDLLISKTKNVMKGTPSFKEIRDALRLKQLSCSDIFRRCSTDGQKNTLLVCNKMNKMSPVFYLLIENAKSAQDDFDFFDRMDDFPNLKSNVTRKQKVANIMECYNMLKRATAVR